MTEHLVRRIARFLRTLAGRRRTSPASPPDPAARPYTRWWWFSGPIEPAVIESQLDWAKANGFGGVEIAWVYPLQDTARRAPLAEPGVDRPGRPCQAACRGPRPGLRLHLRHPLALRRLVRPAGGLPPDVRRALVPAAGSRRGNPPTRTSPASCSTTSTARPWPATPASWGPRSPRRWGDARRPSSATRGRCPPAGCGRRALGAVPRAVRLRPARARRPARRGRARPLRLPHLHRRGGPGRVLPPLHRDLPRPRGRLPRAVPRGPDRPDRRLRRRRHPRDGGPALPAPLRGSPPRPPPWAASRS